MVVRLTLHRVGDAVAVVLPEEALSKLRVREGDAVYVSTAGPDGAVQITSDAEYARQMSAAEAIVERYRTTFADLAK